MPEDEFSMERGLSIEHRQVAILRASLGDLECHEAQGSRSFLSRKRSRRTTRQSSGLFVCRANQQQDPSS